MIVEIENISTPVELNKWYKVHSYKNERKEQLYVRFSTAYDSAFIRVGRIDTNQILYVEMHFSENP